MKEAVENVDLTAIEKNRGKSMEPRAMQKVLHCVPQLMKESHNVVEGYQRGAARAVGNRGAWSPSPPRRKGEPIPSQRRGARKSMRRGAVVLRCEETPSGVAVWSLPGSLQNVLLAMQLLSAGPNSFESDI